MTAALYHLPAGTLQGVGAGQVLEVSGAEAHHAATVKRVRVGEELLLADGSGLVAAGPVVEATPQLVRVEVAQVRDDRPSGPRFVLVQALAKGGRDEQAVEAATELGVDEVVAWQADRCIVRWKGDRGDKALGKWVSTATAAAKQSRRSTVPQVTGPLTTAGLARRAGEAALTLVLHEDATTPLAGQVLPDSGDVLLLVGPEGGISPEEIAALEAAGATAVRLGATVLRSSSAGPAALAVLNAATRWR